MMDPSQTQAMSQDEGLEAILVAQKKIILVKVGMEKRNGRSF